MSDEPDEGVSQQQDEQGLDEEPALYADLPYPRHRFLAYHAPAVKAPPYGTMGMLQLTVAVTRMRKGSYWFNGPMLEISGRSGI